MQKNISLVLGSGGGGGGGGGGGVLNPVPIAPTFSDDTELTIAVSLGGKILVEETVTVDDIVAEETDSSFTRKVTEFVDSMKKSTTNIVSNDWAAYDIANQAFDAMQSTIARQKLAAYPADYFVEIARNACGTLEFDQRC